MTTVLEMENITMEFPGVKALDQVCFTVEKGEIHALCGENGAGKSTLMKILSGFYPHGSYDGAVKIEGKECRFQHIKDAEAAGIAIIYQELALVKGLTVGENLFLGNEPKRWGWIRWDDLYRQTEYWLREVGLEDVRPDQVTGTLGVGKQQLVEIAKALSKHAKLLILDEPTAALTDNEVNILMQILQRLKEQGVTCIYISHKLNEVFRISDTITVLRDGKTVATERTQNLSEDDVVSMMVGRELTDRYPPRSRAHSSGDTVLSVKNYSVWDPHQPQKKIVDEVSFDLKKGEILGIAGLVGAGRSELVMSLFGAYEGKSSGDVYINGQKLHERETRYAIERGIGLVTEDRKKNGLVLGMDVRKNITLAALEELSPRGWVDENEEIRSSRRYVRMLNIKTPSLQTAVGTLSGGNQQKVVIGKSLATHPEVLILDEPTRGIDVGAKYEIYTIMNEWVERGVSIIMISSELPEILGMSHRILVMCEGRMTGEFTRDEASQEKILKAATGG